MAEQLPIALRDWREDDLDLLRRLLRDPAMTEHLGGPESEGQVRKRHERYLAASAGDTVRVFAVTAGPDATDAGWVGYWQTTSHDEPIWETGWAVLPEWQRRGIAVRATALALGLAAAEHRHRYVHAFPAVTNVASNRVCERLGFEFVETADFEYPKGHPLRCNDWRRALW
jgi:RimJ/RimL family protein N-acetyltransferase